MSWQPRERNAMRRRPSDGTRCRRIACEPLEPRLALSAAPFPSGWFDGLSAEGESTTDLAVQATVSGSLQAGGTADLTITVTNQGAGAAVASQLVLQLPEGLRLTRVGGPDGILFALEDHRLDIGLGDLMPAAQLQLVVSATVDSAADPALRFSAVAISDTADADLSDNFATLLIGIEPVAGALQAPATVDLSADSDSGRSAADDVTNAPSLSIDVAGAQPGATIDILVDGAVAASAVAAESAISINVPDAAVAADGIYVITARQQLGNQTSPTAVPVIVTIDRTPPEPLQPALPNTIAAGQQIRVDFSHPEEGRGLSYSMVNGPVTATLDSATGRFTWIPAATDMSDQIVRIRALDAAGNFTEVGDSVLVADSFDAGIRLEAVTAEGVPIETPRVGSTFELRVFAEDRRAGMPLGVFSAYVDLAFDPQHLKLVDPDPFLYGPDFDHGRSGKLARPGLIDELGAFQSQFEPTNLNEQLLVTVRFEVLAAGETSVSSRFAENIGHGIALFGAQLETPPERTRYTTATITAIDRLLARNDFFVTDEDAVAALDVLANDRTADRPSLSIRSTTTPARGSAAVSSDGQAIEFRPPLDESGVAVLSYVVSDASGAESIATVTIAILPVNDPPNAVADAFDVAPNSVDHPLDVLTNDTSTDPGDQFQLVSVTPGTAGGTVLIDQSGSRVRYTPPPGFRGREFFDYTIRDAQGATATATVTVNVVADRARLQNPLLPEDVDGNGLIQPIDALRVINDLNRFGTSDLIIERFDLQPPPFYDVTGDGLISPIDALRVINFLNRNGLPSGEATPATRPSRLIPLPLPSPSLFLPQVSSRDDDELLHHDPQL